MTAEQSAVANTLPSAAPSASAEAGDKKEAESVLCSEQPCYSPCGMYVQYNEEPLTASVKAGTSEVAAKRRPQNPLRHL